MKAKRKQKQEFYKRFWRFYYNLSFVKFYTSIYDTPAYVWYKFHEENDYYKLIKGIRRFPFLWVLREPKHPEFISEIKLYNAFESITDEYIQAFPPKKFLDRLKKRAEIAKMRFDAVAHGERALNTIARLEEDKLHKSIKEDAIKEKEDFTKNCALMQKEFGIYIDPLKITIFEYNNNLNALSELYGSK